MYNLEVIEHLKLYWGMVMIVKLIFGVLDVLLLSCGLKIYCFPTFMLLVWLLRCKVSWGRGLNGCWNQGQRFQIILVNKIWYFLKKMEFITYWFPKKRRWSIEFVQMIQISWHLSAISFKLTLTEDQQRNKPSNTNFCSDMIKIYSLNQKKMKNSIK